MSKLFCFVSSQSSFQLFVGAVHQSKNFAHSHLCISCTKSGISGVIQLFIISDCLFIKEIFSWYSFFMIFVSSETISLTLALGLGLSLGLSLTLALSAFLGLVGFQWVSKITGGFSGLASLFFGLHPFRPFSDCFSI